MIKKYTSRGLKVDSLLLVKTFYQIVAKILTKSKTCIINLSQHKSSRIFLKFYTSLT